MAEANLDFDLDLDDPPRGNESSVG